MKSRFFPILTALAALSVMPARSPAADQPQPIALPASPETAALQPARRALPPHPRLLATDADFARIRSAVTTPGPLHDTYLLLLETAEREYAAPPFPREVIGRRLLGTSRNALRRITHFAMAYRLTGDKKWAARAEQEMLSVAAFSDWNPSHFLDTAEAATGVALGYDWLYDTLSPDTRRTLRKALVTLALTPGDNDKNGWRRTATPNNWLQVCEAGLTLAALAVAEDNPDLAWRTIERAQRSVPKIFSTYEPDGAYVEGTLYWDYGTTYHVILIEALRSATGSAGPLAENRAFLQSARVMNLLTGPTGLFFNYGDSREERMFSAAMYWFARETNQPGLVTTEHTRMRDLLHNAPASSDNVPFPSRFLALSLLWMPAGPAPAAAALPASWSTQGPNPLGVFRNGEGPASLFAAIKGGKPRLSHAHMDSGSFLLDLGGVRWTTDLGIPSYNTIEQAGIQLFGKDRWKVYALNASSHSIPLIDDVQPDDQATATLPEFSAETQTATLNLTPLYAKQAKSLRRTLRVTSPNTIELRDTLAGAQPGARYRFSWMTRAAVTTDAAGATFRLKGKILRLDVTADAPFELVNEDVSQPPAAYDAKQPGLRRVSVLFTVSQPVHTLTVTARLVE